MTLDELITKLEDLDPLEAKIVELRFFAGMNMQEIAEVVGKPKRTVERKWTGIRAWLRRELSEEQAAVGSSGSKPAQHRREPFGSKALTDKFLEGFPKIRAVCARVAALPNMQRWLKTRGPQKF